MQLEVGQAKSTNENMEISTILLKLTAKNIAQELALREGLLNPLNRVMAARLDFEERKFILKCYWKYENAVEVQRQFRREFNKEPPTRVTITRIRDKFEADGIVQDAH
ncbi:uncharacterized protein LOC118763655 [Octopus sinensis]|uniref:Uncharacterized protein LOC118763655 n=1 Tax=Octopus sinensis TaxID=2607531 RepID=A0A7E6EUF4_9MOLL|nr:uncharacterized protein LOC118763655 [Octopus sinensis]